MHGADLDVTGWVVLAVDSTETATNRCGAFFSRASPRLVCALRCAGIGIGRSCYVGRRRDMPMLMFPSPASFPSKTCPGVFDNTDDMLCPPFTIYYLRWAVLIADLRSATSGDDDDDDHDDERSPSPEIVVFRNGDVSDATSGDDDDDELYCLRVRRGLV